jgi:hypothetical protein
VELGQVGLVVGRFARLRRESREERELGCWPKIERGFLSLFFPKFVSIFVFKLFWLFEICFKLQTF